MARPDFKRTPSDILAMDRASEILRSYNLQATGDPARALLDEDWLYPIVDKTIDQAKAVVVQLSTQRQLSPFVMQGVVLELCRRIFEIVPRETFNQPARVSS